MFATIFCSCSHCRERCKFCPATCLQIAKNHLCLLVKSVSRVCLCNAVLLMFPFVGYCPASTVTVSETTTAAESSLPTATDLTTDQPLPIDTATTTPPEDTTLPRCRGRGRIRGLF